MSSSERGKDGFTEVAEESFVRERPLQIKRGAVLAGDAGSSTSERPTATV